MSDPPWLRNRPKRSVRGSVGMGAFWRMTDGAACRTPVRSTQLFATLSQAGLIDTYRLLVIPTALGQGKALFGALTAPLRWRLAGTRTFGSGSVLLEYVPA